MRKPAHRWIVAVLAALSLILVTAVASADTVILDGDGVTPVAASGLNFGSVCAGSTTTKPVVVGINRNGGNNNSFQNNNVQTISVATTTVTPGTVSTTVTDNQTSVPGNWLAAANNTMAVNTATVSVAYTAGAVPATISGSINVDANGTSGSGSSLTRSGAIALTGTIVNCDETPRS